MRRAAPCREGVGRQIERLYHQLRSPYNGGCYGRGTGIMLGTFHEQPRRRPPPIFLFCFLLVHCATATAAAGNRGASAVKRATAAVLGVGNGGRRAGGGSGGTSDGSGGWRGQRGGVGRWGCRREASTASAGSRRAEHLDKNARSSCSDGGGAAAPTYPHASARPRGPRPLRRPLIREEGQEGSHKGGHPLAMAAIRDGLAWRASVKGTPPAAPPRGWPRSLVLTVERAAHERVVAQKEVPFALIVQALAAENVLATVWR